MYNYSQGQKEANISLYNYDFPTITVLEQTHLINKQSDSQNLPSDGCAVMKTYVLWLATCCMRKWLISCSDKGLFPHHEYTNTQCVNHFIAWNGPISMQHTSLAWCVSISSTPCRSENPTDHSCIYIIMRYQRKLFIL